MNPGEHNDHPRSKVKVASRGHWISTSVKRSNVKVASCGHWISTSVKDVAKSRSPNGFLVTLRKSKIFRKVCWSVPFVCLYVCVFLLCETRSDFAKYVGQCRLSVIKFVSLCVCLLRL